MSWKRPEGAHWDCKAQHTSGMEKKHQEWVTETLNFLHTMRVQTYEGGWNADSLEGMELPKGEVLPIPKRLKIFTRTLEKERAEAARTRTKLWETEDALKIERSRVVVAENLLEEIWTVINEGHTGQSYEDMLVTLQAHLEDRRPELFEEEEEDDGKSQRV